MKIGKTLASLYLPGTIPVVKEQLCIISSGFEITDLISNCNNFVGILKDPVDLDELSIDISVSISAAVGERRKKLCFVWGFKNWLGDTVVVGIVLPSSFPMFAK